MSSFDGIITHCIYLVNNILLIAMQDLEDTCYASAMATPGRPRKGRELRKPSDYPQYVFRVSRTHQKRLEALLDEVVDLLNSKKEPGDIEETRSSVMAKSVYRGLEQLKKIHSKS